MVRGFVWPSIIWGLLALGVVAYLIGRRVTKRRRDKNLRLVAGTANITALASYKTLMFNYRLLRAVGVVIVLFGLLSAGVLAARPVERETITEMRGTRDIVLCFDVSFSMLPYNTEIAENFVELVEGFNGERVGMSIWNVTSSTVFPLTDDYDVVIEELRHAADVMSYDLSRLYYRSTFPEPGEDEDWDELWAFLNGTLSLDDEENSSLAGDGLASCGLMFDYQQDERPRSVIFVTDNEVYGSPIYQLDEAVDLIVGRQIVLYGMHGGGAGWWSSSTEDEMRNAVEDAGGQFYKANDPSAVEAILEEIQTHQMIDTETAPEILLHDRIFPWVIFVLLLPLGVVAILWGVRE